MIICSSHRATSLWPPHHPPPPDLPPSRGRKLQEKCYPDLPPVILPPYVTLSYVEGGQQRKETGSSFPLRRSVNARTGSCGLLPHFDLAQCDKERSLLSLFCHPGFPPVARTPRYSLSIIELSQNDTKVFEKNYLPRNIYKLEYDRNHSDNKKNLKPTMSVHYFRL